jgi:hypothetical protein
MQHPVRKLLTPFEWRDPSVKQLSPGGSGLDSRTNRTTVRLTTPITAAILPVTTTVPLSSLSQPLINIHGKAYIASIAILTAFIVIMILYLLQPPFIFYAAEAKIIRPTLNHFNVVTTGLASGLFVYFLS